MQLFKGTFAIGAASILVFVHGLHILGYKDTSFNNRNAN